MQSYRRPGFVLPRLSSVVKKLIIGLFVAYVAQTVLDGWLGVPVKSTLAMWPGSAALWQLVTYVVVDFSHPLFFLLGLFFLWWALSPFEIGYGPKRTIQLCAVTALAASVPAYLAGAVIPGSPPLYGSHPLWFGSIAAVAWLSKSQQVSLFGLVSMQMKHLLWGLVALTFLMFLWSKNHTQLFADLGAMGGGIAFVNWMKRPRKQRPRRKPAARAPRGGGGLKVIPGGGGEDEDRPKWLN